MSREEVREKARAEARKRITAANQTQLRMKARVHRGRALKLWETGDLTDMVQAMWELCEATRVETYLDMLRDEQHGMWECIEIERVRKSEKQSEGGVRYARSNVWNPDPMRGYKGKECIRFIDASTQKIARLTFR